MTGHTLLDLALVLLLVSHAVRGWLTGALVSVLGLAGLLLGAAGGLWLVPRLISRWGSGLADPLPVVLLAGGVLVTAQLGEALLRRIGLRLRAQASGQSARRLDAGLGALASMLVVSIVVTLLGGAVRPSLPRSLAATLNQSRVLP
ncbi:MULTISPECIES: CvpA family protein [unclassified Luteococcus]|uniref:CvpA family protein n=1 Tax=unclassified Luteococcus TaxID=2639923 RepID=UPI00313CF6D2